MKNKPMKMRYCPHCAQLVHFEESQSVQMCWNCHCVSNFAFVKSPQQRLEERILRCIGVALDWMFRPVDVAGRWLFGRSSRVNGAAKLIWSAAIPAVVTMLLISNSFDIRIVHDLTTSFQTLPLPGLTPGFETF